MENITKDRFEELYEDGQYDEIIQAFAGVDENQLSYDEKGMLMRAHVMAGNYDKTRVLLEAMEPEGNEDPVWYYRWGYLYFVTEEYKKAEAALRNALQLSGDDAQTLYLLCMVLVQMDRQEEADQISNDFKESNPEEWEEVFGSPLVNAPEEGKTGSIMCAVLPGGAPEEESGVEALLERLKDSSWFDLVDIDVDDDGYVATVSYQDENYIFGFIPCEFEMTDMYRISHHLNDKNQELLEKADQAIMVSMFFGPDPMISYHLQLRILQTLAPELIAVTDETAFTVYSPLWVMLAAEASVPPSPEYLYTIHAVYNHEEEDEEKQAVWLHTHGLNRCGSPELEIVNTTVAASQNHYHIINNMAMRAVMDGEMVEEGEPLYLAQTQEYNPVVTTWMAWEKVIDTYDPDMLGGRTSREDDDHNGDSGIIYLYMSQEDYENKKISPVTVLPDSDFENLLVMYTSEETERMSTQARERLPYLMKGLELDESNAIVKMGLPVDEDRREEAGTDWEHIWFEVEEIDTEHVTAKLMQEPYFFKHIQVGQTVTLPVSMLTDWRMYIGETLIDPDRAYLLAAL